MSLLKPHVTFTVTNKTIFRIIAIVFGTFMLLRFFNSVAHGLTLIFISFFLSLALNPAVSRIMHHLPGRSRARAAGVAYIIVLSVLIGFFSLVVPPLIKQTNAFVRDVPSIVSNFKQQDSALSRFATRYNLDTQIDAVGDDIANRVGGVRPVITTANRIGSMLVSVITVFILTFMMLIEGPMWLEKFWALQPSAHRERRKKLAVKMYRVVTAYVNGQLIIATIAGAFSLIVMVILGVPNAIALAGIISLFGLIPLIGSTLGAAVVVLVTLFTSVKLALIMAVYFLVYQQVENATLQPYIQSRANELTPLSVFIAALLGAGLGGLLGALVAIPAAGCIKILLEDYINRKHLTHADVANPKAHSRHNPLLKSELNDEPVSK
jgi:predicted PurR-regulated permease PerM